MRYADGDLRDIRLGATEIVRRIYMVFQDRNWTARPWTILEEDVHQEADSFRVALTARGTFDAASFTWTGTLAGETDGTIRFTVEGEAHAPFIRNRLGLCVLHPMSLAGTPAVLERVDDGVVRTAFPEAISPDPPFTDMRALTHEVRPGVVATVRMTGDTFESEDHRNWSDASFKHYCTPISLPFPVTVQPGERIAQSVVVTVDGPVSPEPWLAPALRIDVSDERRPLPALGVQLDHDGHRPTPIESERLAALRLAHVRVDIEAAAADALVRLDDALAQATAFGALLVPALHVSDPYRLEPFAPYADDPRIHHWLVFDPATKVTDRSLVDAAARSLGARVGGGTDLYFTELNRGRPEPAWAMTFSINPQVHASDDESILQNARTQGVIAANARALYPDAFLEASPITLRPRWNPNATEPELDHSNTPLPSRVDARQCTDVAAVWTTLSVKAIAESGCLDAVTYFETTGWEGVMERIEGSPQPADFPSRPGATYPVYDVLAALAGCTHVRVCRSTDPDRVDALALEDGTVLLANLTPMEVDVELATRRVSAAPMSVTIVTPEGRP